MVLDTGNRLLAALDADEQRQLMSLLAKLEP